MKRALITGIYGQDGAYLAKHLIAKGYKVVGGARRSSLDETFRLRYLDIVDEVEIINLDLTEPYNIFSVIQNGDFAEIYNLGAQSFVGASWDFPVQTMQIDAAGPLYILDAIRRVSPDTKFYQASTSEMFGMVQDKFQVETTPFYPRSPYGVSKLFAHSMTVNYRESFNLFACSGILFNHESPLRGSEFVTKKITRQLCEIKLGFRKCLYLGNLDAKRDWGFAGEYVVGMWKMLQHEIPDDFVLATGQAYSVREFCDFAAEAIGLQSEWVGQGLKEVGIDKISGKVIVRIDAKFYRPAEVDFLLGDAGKAKKILGWTPAISIHELAEMMIKYDYNDIQRIAQC